MTADPSEPLDPFYRVTAEDLRGDPGDVIRSRPLTGSAALESADSTHLVVYRSTSAMGGDRHGEPIGVSGLVAVPKGPAPVGGWPVVSWAHGTVGSADKCAPSMDSDELGPPADSGIGLLRKINKAPHTLLNAFLEAGWVVAMTDYEGLGTYGNHPYLLGESEGRGIIDIARAAGRLPGTAGRISDRYVIVGHSQGGQAALFGAHLASTGRYPGGGTVLGVAALAPASNMKDGLWVAYQSPVPIEDLGGFIPLFCNGVFGGDPTIDKSQIFQDQALEKYLADHDTKARVELSEDPFWADRPPLAALDKPRGLFRTQVLDAARAEAWARYWAQVDAFNPAKEIRVPIRVSLAEGDTRVLPLTTRKLIEQLDGINTDNPVRVVAYEKGTVATPEPALLGEHFGLLVDPDEVAALVRWSGTLLT
ncbi:alpha/beta hydrolase family protein [Kitasatospora sp. NPDC089509]|uniref:alpha/beta hydrolase family protein n=1 Tax=Kitasatospora sp. NPDC089509 TaxID=3364079 RepID=UPI00382C3984